MMTWVIWVECSGPEKSHFFWMRWTMAVHGAQNDQRFYIHKRETNTTTRENSWLNHEYWRFNGIMSGNIMGYSKPTNISNLNHWSTSGEFIEFSQNSSGASYHLYENISQGLSKWFLPKIKVTATGGFPNIFQTGSIHSLKGVLWSNSEVISMF